MTWIWSSRKYFQKITIENSYVDLFYAINYVEKSLAPLALDNHYKI